MGTYTITGFWEDGFDTHDTGVSKGEIVSIVAECLGDGCIGFEIHAEEN